MRNYPIARPALLVVMVLFTVGAAACSCPFFLPGPDGIRAEAAISDAVVIGRVIDTRLGENTIQVIRNFKGVADYDTIVSRDFTSCSTIYPEGYYIFYGFLKDSIFDTSYCSSNQKIELSNYAYAVASASTVFEALLAEGFERYDLHTDFLVGLFAENQCP